MLWISECKPYRGPFLAGSVFFVLTLLLLFLHEAQAIPQFDARFGSTAMPGHEMHQEPSYGMACGDCHINPTGGGMRNEHGREFAIDLLPMTGRTEAVDQAVEAAKITPYLSIGTDIRFAYLRSEREGEINEESFFPMQADLYLAFTPADHLTVYYQDGVEEHGAPPSRETFVLLHRLPFGSYAKVGRFIPPYGQKLDDHTSFIREKLGFGAPLFGRDSGVEVGFREGHWFGHAAYVNGSNSYRDDDREKGISAAAGFRAPLFWLGGSYLHNETATDDKKTYAGAYGALHLWKLTLLGEWDRTIVESAGRLTGWVGYAELDVDIVRGVVAKLKYDGYDPDRDTSDDELTRLTFGLDLYPYPFTEVLVQYRRNIEDADLSNDQFLAMMHLFY